MNNKLLKGSGKCYQHQDHAVIYLQHNHLDHKESSQRTNKIQPATCSHESTKNCVRPSKRDYGHELFLDILDNITTKLTWQQHFYAPRMCFSDRDDTRQQADLVQYFTKEEVTWNLTLNNSGQSCSYIVLVTTIFFVFIGGCNFLFYIF